jgi:hypothetical protein
MTQHEKNMDVKNKQGQCSVIGLFHTLKFNFFCHLYGSFTFGAQMGNVNFHLTHP